MPRTPTARSGTSDSRPATTTARPGSGTWLVALLPLLACCGVHLLVAGAVLAGWALLGTVGAAAIAAAGLGTVLWWRHRRGDRCGSPRRDEGHLR